MSEPTLCPVHHLPDCSPLLNGCTRLTPRITCPICQMTSYHPQDIAQGYCANCHAWTSVGVSSPTDH